MPDDLDLLQAYREQARAKVSGGTPDDTGADTLDTASIRRSVDKRLDQEQADQVSASNKAMSDAKRQMMQQSLSYLHQQRIPFRRGADGIPTPILAPDGGILRQKFGSSNFISSKTGKIYRQGLTSDDFVEAPETTVGKDGKIRDAASRIVGIDPSFQGKKDDVDLLHQAHEVLMQQKQDITQNTQPTVKQANIAYKKAADKFTEAQTWKKGADDSGKPMAPEDQATYDARKKAADDAKSAIDDATNYRDQKDANVNALALHKDHLRDAKAGNLAPEHRQLYSDLVSNANVKARDDADAYGGAKDNGSTAEAPATSDEAAARAQASAGPPIQQEQVPASQASPITPQSNSSTSSNDEASTARAGAITPGSSATPIPTPPIPQAATAPAPTPQVQAVEGSNPASTGQQAAQAAKTQGEAITAPTDLPQAAAGQTPQPSAPAPAPAQQVKAPAPPVLATPPPPAPPVNAPIATPDMVASLGTEDARSVIDASSATLQARGAALAAKQQQVSAPLAQADQKIADFWQTNTAAIQNGRESKQVFAKDGTPLPAVATHLWDQLQDLSAGREQTRQQVQSALDVMSGDANDYHADAAQHQAAVDAYNSRVQSENEQAKQKAADEVKAHRDSLRSAGYGGVADSLDTLDEEHADNAHLLAQDVDPSTSAGKAAQDDLSKQYDEKRKIAMQPVRDAQLASVANKVYQVTADAEDKKTKESTKPSNFLGDSPFALSPSDPDFLDYLKKTYDAPAAAKVKSALEHYGMTDEEIKPFVEDAASMDFGRNKKEAVALNSGSVIVNPKNYLDEGAYKQAVAATDGTPEAKQAALDKFPDLQQKAAQSLYDSIKGHTELRQYVDSFPGDTDGDKIVAMTKQGKLSNFADKVVLEVSAGLSGLAKDGVALSAMVAGLGDKALRIIGAKSDSVSALSDYLHDSATNLEHEQRAYSGLAEQLPTFAGGHAISKIAGFAPDFAAAAAGGELAKGLSYAVGGVSKTVAAVNHATTAARTAAATGDVAGANKAFIDLLKASGVTKEQVAEKLAALKDRFGASELHAPGDILNAMKEVGGENIAKAFASESAMASNAAAGVWGGKSTGGTYQEAYEKNLARAKSDGLSDEDAKQQARVHSIVPALVNGAITYSIFKNHALGDMFDNEKATAAMLKQSFAQVAKDVGAHAAIDAGKMGLDTLARDLVAKASYDPDKSPDDILKETLMSALQGAAFGGVTRAWHQAAMRMGQGKAGPLALPGQGEPPKGGETPPVGPAGGTPAVAPVTPDEEPETPEPSSGKAITAGPEAESMRRSSLQTASNTELSELSTHDPETAQRANVLRQIANGESIHTMPVADLQSIGLDRNSSGAIVPVKGTAKQPAPVPDVYLVKGADGEMKPVITDGAIADMARQAPATSKLVNMSESEALTHYNKQPEIETEVPASATIAPKTETKTPESGTKTAKGETKSETAKPTKASVEKVLRGTPAEPESPETAKKGTETAKSEPTTDPAAALTKWGANNLHTLAPKAQAKAAGLLKLATEALKPFAGSFEHFTVGETETGSGFTIDRDGGLTINPHGLMRDMAKIGNVKAASKYVADSIDEEFRHRVSVILENKSPTFKKNLAKVWKLLPSTVKVLSSQTYHGSTKPDVGFMDDWTAKHEFFRQFWQIAKIRRMTEQAFYESGKHGDLKALVDNYVEELGKLGESVHPDLKAALDDLMAEAEQEAARLKKGEFTPESTEKEGDVSQPPANAPPREKSVGDEKTTEKEGGITPTVDAAAHEAATSPHNEIPEPTASQKANGNYAKGHLKLAGLDISIENPAGSQRKPEWAALNDHYGYVKGEGEGADGDHHDVFVKAGTPLDWSGPVFVINQMKADGSFDETKTVLGATDANDAHKVYARNYEPNWKGYGSMAAFPDVAAYKKWLATADMTKAAKSPRAKRTEKEQELTNPSKPVQELRTRLLAAKDHDDLESIMESGNAVLDAAKPLEKTWLKEAADIRGNELAKQKPKPTAPNESPTIPSDQRPAAPELPGQPGGQVAEGKAGDEAARPAQAEEAQKPQTTAEANESTRARLIAEGKTSVKPKKLTAKNTLDALRKYFAPGAVVDSYGGKDRVISFSGTDLSNWRVKVHGLDEQGNDKPDDVRDHATQPSRKALEAALNKSVLPSPTLEKPATTPTETEAMAAAAKSAELAREERRSERYKQTHPQSPAVAKEQKKYLLSALDSAIADAPEAESLTEGQRSVLEALKNPAPDKPTLPSQPVPSTYPEGEEKPDYVLDREKRDQDYYKQKKAEHETNLANYNEALPKWESEMTATKQRVRDEIGHVHIEIPGDGTFDILNTKETLEDFRKRAKTFPVATPKADEPAQSKPASPTSILPVTTKPKAEDFIKAALPFASTDDLRRSINRVISDGKHVIATDGRRLIVLAQKVAGTEKNPVSFDLKGRAISGKDADDLGKIPNWQQVIPSETSLTKVFDGLDTERLMRVLAQANTVLTDRSNSAKFHLNPDKSLGISVSTADVGEYEHNIQTGNHVLGALNPDYVMDALRAARAIGHDKVSISGADEVSPFVVEAPGMKAVIMPMRINGAPEGQEFWDKGKVSSILEGKPLASSPAESTLPGEQEHAQRALLRETGVADAASNPSEATAKEDAGGNRGDSEHADTAHESGGERLSAQPNTLKTLDEHPATQSGEAPAADGKGGNRGVAKKGVQPADERGIEGILPQGAIKTLGSHRADEEGSGSERVAKAVEAARQKHGIIAREIRQSEGDKTQKLRSPTPEGGKPSDLESALGDLTDYEPTAADLKAWQEMQKHADAGTPDYIPGTTIPEMPQGSVGTRNAFTDWQRKMRDLPPRMKPAARAFGPVWDEAMAVIAKNDKAGSDLIDTIKEHPRALTDTERAILTHEFLKRSQNQDNAAQAVNSATDPTDRATNLQWLARARDEYFDAMVAAERAGTESGRSLNAIRMAIMEDFSLARLEARMRAAHGGSFRNAEHEKNVMAQVAKLHADIERTQKALDASEAEKSAMFTREQLDKMLADAKAEPKTIIRYRTRTLSAAESLASKMANALEQWQKIGLSAPVLSAAKPDDRFNILADIGAGTYANGEPDLAEWLDRMDSHGHGIGDAARENAAALYEEAKARYQKSLSATIRKSAAMQTPGGILDAIREGNEGIDPAGIRALALAHIKAGATEADEVLRLVHADLRAIMPNITEREVADAISGHGHIAEPDQDPHKKILAEIKSQLDLLSKIAELEAGEAALRKGSAPKHMSDRVRQLWQQVRETMKDHPEIIVTDPQRQLTMPLDAIRTRLRHRKSDIERQLATGHRDPKSNNSPTYTDEMRAMQGEIDVLAKALDELDPKAGLTDEQRMERAEKAVERSIAELEKKIAAGDTSTRAKMLGPDPLSLSEQKAHREELQEQLQRMRDAKNPKLTPDERALKQLKRRLNKSTAELKRKEEEIRKTGKPTAPKAKKRSVMRDEEADKLLAENLDAKSAFLQAENKAILAARPWPLRALSYTAQFGRFVKIGGFTVLGKLFTAANLRHITTPAESLVSAGWSLVPGIRGISKQGHRAWGFSVGTEAQAFASGMIAAIKNIPDRWHTGKSNWESAMDFKRGADLYSPERSWMDYMGHLHMIMKSPAVEVEFRRSLARRAAYYMSQGIDISLPGAAMRIANAAVRDAYDESMLGAFEDSQRAKLMNPNLLHTMYQAGLRAAETDKRFKDRGGKYLAQVFRILFPIVKIPANYVTEAFRYSPVGLPTAILEAAVHIARGIEKMTPEQSESVRRHLGKGTIGLALLLLGFFSPDNVGGYYQEHEKRRKGEVKAGGFRIFGWDVPRWMSHTPALEAIQFGATIRRVLNHMAAKKKGPSAEELENIKSGSKDALSGVFGDLANSGRGFLAGLSGLLDEIPFVSGIRNTMGALNPAESHDKDRANFALNMTVPQFIQQGTAAADRRKTPEHPTIGEPIQRETKTFGQTFKGGIPGLRTSVPEKGGPFDDLGYRKGEAHTPTNLEKVVDLTAVDKYPISVPKIGKETLDGLPDDPIRQRFAQRAAEMTRKITNLTSGEEDPDSTTGKTGDFYKNTKSNELFQKDESSAWVSRGKHPSIDRISSYEAAHPTDTTRSKVISAHEAALSAAKAEFRSSFDRSYFTKTPKTTAH